MKARCSKDMILTFKGCSDHSGKQNASQYDSEGSNALKGFENLKPLPLRAAAPYWSSNDDRSSCLHFILNGINSSRNPSKGRLA